MTRPILIVGAFVLLTACAAPIPDCSQVSCDHPTGKFQGDGILQPQPQAFAPAGAAAPDDSDGGAVR